MLSKKNKDMLSIVCDSVREVVPGMTSHFNSEYLQDESAIHAARALATKSFVALGKIDKEEVDEEGVLIDDPILPISNFFATYDIRNNQIMATSRLLWGPDVSVNELRLPLEQIDDEYAEKLLHMDKGKVAEVGSLAKIQGAPNVTVIKLLSAMWRFAGDNNIDQFVCGLEPKVYPSFKNMFGDAVEPMSRDTVTFPGIHGEQIPLITDVRRAAEKQHSTEVSTITQRMTRFAIRHYITSHSKNVNWHK